MRKWLLLVLLLAAAAAVTGCQTIRFYGQAIRGQYQILANQTSVDELIADPETPEELRRQLQLVRQLRAFADTNLALPVDGHYARYVDVRRPYVVWNVQAAPPFSLEAKTWWYPLVGSLEYRGYFSKRGAEAAAARLERKGYDVFISGVDAYSTLGWFKDPVLNTFIHRSEAELAELIFHELAHQRVFARGDTDFNEAFATMVGTEGAQRWLRAHGDTNQFEAYLASLRQEEEFVRLVMDARAKLERLYGDVRDRDGNLRAAGKPPAPAAELQAGKERILAELRRDYAELKARWQNDRYDAWFERELNNAQLNTIANYYDYVPGFQALLKLEGGEMAAFYEAAERLANMPKEERHRWLRDLANEGGGDENIQHRTSNIEHPTSNEWGREHSTLIANGRGSFRSAEHCVSACRNPAF